MQIGGIEKLTLIDYPGELAAIIFTQGCNFRCHFCYNPMLVWPREVGELIYHQDHSSINQNDLFDFLQERIGRLDGVVVTGGEPTLHSDLPEFLTKIKKMGYKIKLDSNGTNPEAFLPLLTKERGGVRLEADGDLINYIAMDIKAPLDKYEQVVGVKVNGENIQKSIELIKKSGLPYEFRTTMVPGLHTLEDIDKMGALIMGAGEKKAAKWYLQFFKSDTPLVDRTLETKSKFTHAEMEAMAEAGKKYADICEVRG